MMDKANEAQYSTNGQIFGTPAILWDTEKNREMTPSQKIAFLLRATGGPSDEPDRFESSWKHGRLAGTIACLLALIDGSCNENPAIMVDPES
jgi:hypothetical protein